MIRTRIAPSPTGYPHIGTIYQALFDLAWAKKNSGSFIVRIEDTDQGRFVADAEEKIFSSLDWFNLIEDESVRKSGSFGPYRQSERLEIYKEYAEELVSKGHAYYCFCTKERLEEIRKKQQEEHKAVLMYDKHCRDLQGSKSRMQNGEEYTIRLKIPENTKITVHDEIRGNIDFDSNTIDDQVLLKSDGFPTYHLAVVADDHLMEITDVVRGEEWISSFPKHQLLYNFFGWHAPRFYHTPVLRNPDHSKLSKRHGHTNVQFYKEEGFLPEAILNFLALCGWSHPEEKEIFSLGEFIQLFNPKDLKPVGPIFDLQKLEWMNGEYIRQLSISNFKFQILNYDENLKEIDDEILEKLLPIVQTRIKTLKEFKDLVQPFLNPQKLELSDEEKQLKENLKNDLEKVQNWIQEEIAAVLFENYIKPKRANFKTLYKILIGIDRGLPLADTFAAIGKEKTIKLCS